MVTMLLVTGALSALTVPPALARLTDTDALGGNTFGTAASFTATVTLYLKTSGPGNVASSPVLPLTAVAPTVATLPNYDTNRDSSAGLSVTAGGTDATTVEKSHQVWSQTQPTGGLVLAGNATLTLWSSMKDFRARRGVVTAYLRECTPADVCTTFDTVTVDVANWSGGTANFVSKSFDFGAVNRTIAAGQKLHVRVVVGTLAADDMWFAYDTTTHPTRLVIG